MPDKATASAIQAITVSRGRCHSWPAACTEVPRHRPNFSTAIQLFAAMKKLLTAAGLAGLTGVALGAFGAHALKDTLAATPTGAEIWRTATLYHLVHAVAALAVPLALAAGGANFSAGVQRLLRAAAACWLAGVALFSGSLYWLALGGPKWLGPVTPLGGLALLVGWTLVVFAGWKGGAEK
jgi:uncharacterized membrane protein YgdD (TMEM256/DUF423 family)